MLDPFKGYRIIKAAYYCAAESGIGSTRSVSLNSCFSSKIAQITHIDQFCSAASLVFPDCQGFRYLGYFG